MTVVGATRNLRVGPEAGRYTQEEIACLILPTQLNLNLFSDSLNFRLDASS